MIRMKSAAAGRGQGMPDLLRAPLTIDVRVADRGWQALLGPDAEAFVARVLKAAGRQCGRAGEVAVLLTDDAEMRTLNRTWKSKDKPTNVLSFPAPEGFGSLGDIALGLETIRAEAETQSKTLEDHTAHLLVHGYLHLLGMDHIHDDDAQAMEARERAILADLGVADPYADDQGGDPGGKDTEGAARKR
jgi:probable rRNA maturation factor